MGCQSTPASPIGRLDSSHCCWRAVLDEAKILGPPCHDGLWILFYHPSARSRIYSHVLYAGRLGIGSFCLYPDDWDSCTHRQWSHPSGQQAPSKRAKRRMAWNRRWPRRARVPKSQLRWYLG